MNNDQMIHLLKDLIQELDKKKYKELFEEELDRLLVDELILLINYHVNVMPRLKGDVLHGDSSGL